MALILSATAGQATNKSSSSLGELKARLKQRIHATSGPAAGQTSGQWGTRQTGSEVNHHGARLHCSDCHVMHASKDGQTFGGGGANPSGYAKLLRGATSLEVCLTCHDGVAGIPDVVGADVNGLSERAAGFFASPGSPNPNGHRIGPAETDLCLRCHFGGDFQSAEVTCIDCHNPHGSGTARNLQWASDPEGTPPLGLFIAPGATGMDRYEAANISYGTDGTSNLREVTNMCLDCHHTVSGDNYTDVDGDGNYEKHPVTETERGVAVPVSQGDAEGTTDSGHWVAGSGAGFDVPRLRFLVNPATSYSAATGVSEDNEVFCLTCHKAHGSSYPDGVVWPPNSDDSVGPSGCDQCHNKSE